MRVRPIARPYTLTAPSLELKGQARYWEYVQGHPNHLRKLPDGAWQQAHDALSWCYADRLLFKHTNATFSKEDSKELLEMLERLEKSESGPVNPTEDADD